MLEQVLLNLIRNGMEAMAATPEAATDTARLPSKSATVN
jgi:C4-dicarboxylate-specific signal transduction histidine kinase